LTDPISKIPEFKVCAVKVEKKADNIAKTAKKSPKKIENGGLRCLYF